MSSNATLRTRNLSIVFFVLGLGALAWAYAGTIAVLARKWEADPQYSHGWLVPVFSLVLLWLRRDKLEVDRLRPSVWGVFALALALALRHVSSMYFFEWFEQLSLVCCVPAIALLVGGFAALRWAWPACLFLVFMVPLPFTLEVALRDPLRRIGTVASTYVMQTVGLPAYAEGRVIVVDQVRIGVVEACSGLRMLMIFFALATAVAMVGERPFWQRVLIVLSAVPIALISNIARITATGSLHALGYESFADLVFHDLAGWLMMPLALVLLGIETAYLDRLVFVDSDEPARMASVGAMNAGDSREVVSVSMETSQAEADRSKRELPAWRRTTVGSAVANGEGAGGRSRS